MIISSYPSSYMNLWLKAEGYSVVQINQLPTVINAITIVASWLGSTVAAIWPPWAIYTFATACMLFSTLCMIIWTIPTGLKYVCSCRILQGRGVADSLRFVAWYFFGVSGCLSPILYSTVNTIVKNDSEERALIMVNISICIPGPRLTLSGVHDDFRIQLQHLGTFATFPDRRARWRSEMAQGLACDLRLLFPAMVWVHRSSNSASPKVVLDCHTFQIFANNIDREKKTKPPASAAESDSEVVVVEQPVTVTFKYGTP